MTQLDRSDRLDRALAFALVIALLAGAIARFANLDHPLFWQDENATAIRATAHSDRALASLYDGKAHSAAEVLSFTRGGQGPLAAVVAISRDEPQRTPLFFATEATWILAFGTSPQSYRLLSEAFGLCVIVLAFFLATALTDSRRSGAVAVVLLAASPLFVLYSRQAREYMMFCTCLLLASLALRAAWRSPSVRTWGTFSALTAIGIYIDPLYAVVLAAHFVASAVRARQAGELRLALGSAAASATAVLLFLPFYLYMRAAAAVQITSDQFGWAHTTYPFSYSALKWIFNLGSLTFDGEYAKHALNPLGGLCALAIVAAFGFGMYRANAEARALVGSVVAVPILCLMLLDTVQHAHFATVDRYLFASWTGVMLGAAIGIGALLEGARTRAFGFAALGLCVALGLFAAQLRDRTLTWWDDVDILPYRMIAATIGRSPAPVVYSEDRGRGLLVLARYVPETTTFVLCAPGTLPAGSLPSGAYLFTPSPAFLRAAQARGKMTNVSPADRSAMADFKTALHRDVKATVEPPDPTSDPANALWVAGSR